MASWDDVRTSLGDGAKPWVVAAAREIVAACPYPIYWAWAYPGNGVSGDHPKGLALDIGNRDIGGGTTKTAGPERRAVQNWVKGYMLTHQDRLGLTYLIADDQIASEVSNPDWTWREYDGSNPHTDHVHGSFKASWTYRPPTPPEDDMPTVQEIAKAVADLDAKPYGGVEGVSLGRYIVGSGVKLDAEKQRDKAEDLDDVADQTELRELLGQVAASLNLIHQRLNELTPPS